MASKQQEKDQRVGKIMDIMKKPEGKLRNISITPAENGYTVSTDREMPPAKGAKDADSPMSTYQPPSQSVFNSKEDVLSHIDKHLD